MSLLTACDWEICRIRKIFRARRWSARPNFSSCRIDMSRRYDDPPRKRIPCAWAVFASGHLGIFCHRCGGPGSSKWRWRLLPYVRCLPDGRRARDFSYIPKGETMWRNPISSTAAANWRGWISRVYNDRSVTHPAANWKHRLEVPGGTCNELLPCGHCGLAINGGLAKLCVGTCAPSAVSGNEAGSYPNVFPGGRQAVVERPWAGAGCASYDSWMVDGASSSSQNGSAPTNPSTSSFRNGKWRSCVSGLLTETDLYINLRREQGNVKYSEIGMREVMRSVADLLREAGGAAEAERQFLQPQLAKLTETMSFVERTHHIYHDIVSEAMSIYTNGDDP